MTDVAETPGVREDDPDTTFPGDLVDPGDGTDGLDDDPGEDTSTQEGHPDNPETDDEGATEGDGLTGEATGTTREQEGKTRTPDPPKPAPARQAKGRKDKRDYEVYEVTKDGKQRELVLIGTTKAGDPTEARWNVADKDAALKARIYDKGETVKLVAVAPLTVTPTKAERVEKIIRH